MANRERMIPVSEVTVFSRYKLMPRDFAYRGNHARVEAWGRDRAEALTRDRRPDLIKCKKKP